MPWRFDGCRERIDRAKNHYDALAERWNTVQVESLYRTIVKVEDDGTGGMWLQPREEATLFKESALLFGEFLYQLRSALDACVYQAAIIDSKSDPPPNDDRLEFPIFDDPAKFRKKAAIALAPLADKRKRVIESVQPYPTTNIPADQLVFSINRSLGILGNWARKDRHRSLHLFGCLLRLLRNCVIPKGSALYT